jgi:hypothetical protein
MVVMSLHSRGPGARLWFHHHWTAVFAHKLQEILGMTNYVAPAYDMWKFGCLMYEAATGIKLFSAALKQALLTTHRNWGYGDQHYLLAAMVNVLGHVPQKVSGPCIQLIDHCYICSSEKSKPFTAWCIMRNVAGWDCSCTGRGGGECDGPCAAEGERPTAWCIMHRAA